ncbi:MAG: IclR family transcriptional regulator C-terminal domain-containing protein [Hyphomicrobiales bacterium]|nr:IclR family transcriptional regulator C-terminal domain-containing protein [Hyphomicrobiales bacterium]
MTQDAIPLKVIRKEKVGGRDTVQSLSRALNLMNAIAASEHGVTLSEAAKETRLAVSTAHRLLTTLQQDRFVRFDSERGVWTIGVQAFSVGSAFLRARELTVIARPFMRQLMERSGETVNLAVEDRGEAIYVSQVECRKLMRAITRPGGRALMHASAIGKALMSAMSEEEVDKIVEMHGLPRETDKTISTPTKLRTELAIVRQRGYAVDDEENAIGLRCIAAVVYDEHAHPVAGLSLSGPMARISDDSIAGLGDAVFEAAKKITANMGGRTPAKA